MKTKIWAIASLVAVTMVAGAHLCSSVQAGSKSALRRSSLAQGKHPPDKVIATKTVNGKFLGFESADYLHAVIEKADGKKQGFFIGPPAMEYFLVLHLGEQLTLTYQVVDSYIPEAGGVERIERLTAAKAGTLTYAAWWASTKKKFTMAQLEKKYGKLVEKSTKQ